MDLTKIKLGKSPREPGKHIGKLPIIIACTVVGLLVVSVFLGIIGRLEESTIDGDSPAEGPTLGGTVSNDDSSNASTFEIPIDREPINLNTSIPDHPNAVTTPELVNPQPIADPFAELKERQELGRLSVSQIETGNLSAPRILPLPAESIGEPLSRVPEDNRDYSGIRDLLSSGLQDAGQRVDPNNQAGKAAYFANNVSSAADSGYLLQTVHPPVSPFELKAGSLIPGILLTAINTDLPGLIVGQVSRNVYDSVSGRYLLVPQGARLIGDYDSQITYGQKRALVAWRKIIFPDGGILNLAGMRGIDQAGHSGFRDKVNRHYGRLFGSIFLLSIFQAIGNEIGDQDNDAVDTSELEKVAAANIAETGRELTERNLGIQPTIRVRAGYVFNIFVERDIVFPRAYNE